MQCLGSTKTQESSYVYVTSDVNQAIQQRSESQLQFSLINELINEVSVVIKQNISYHTYLVSVYCSPSNSTWSYIQHCQ